MRHKHADLIIAWANGAQIEYKNALKVWMEVDSPEWISWVEYRIKPEPKPDYVRYLEVRQPFGEILQSPYHNVKATFDGETGALKSVEVIK